MQWGYRLIALVELPAPIPKVTLCRADLGALSPKQQNHLHGILDTVREARGVADRYAGDAGYAS